MIGKLYGYTFSFDDGVTPVECSPLIDSLVWLDTYDEDLGIYRRTLDTSFAFQGADYDYLLALDEDGCGEIDLLIEYKAAEVYRGIIRFGTQNVDVDLEACIITLTIDPRDDYTCLLESWDAQVNLIQGVQRFTARALANDIEINSLCLVPDYASFQAALNAGAPTDCLLDSPANWSLIDWEITPVDPNDPDTLWVSTASWAQEQATADCDGTTPVPPPGSGWVLADNRCGSDGTADWVRPAVVVFDRVNSVEEPFNELWHQIWNVLGVTDGEVIEYTTGMRLGDVLAAHLPCDLAPVSDFFNISPDGTAPANAEYAAAAIDLTEVLVFQKSDVKRPNAVQAATRGDISMSKFFELLRLQFDIKIRVQGTNLRIEHRSYFERNTGLDLTEARFSGQALAGLGYSYTGAELARLERWKFAEEFLSQQFRGRPIEYSGCLPTDAQEEQVYLMERLNNDIGFITENPDNIQDDGFSFAAAAAFGATRVIITSESADNGEPLFNAPMSIPNLLDKYHRRNRMLIEGRLNGTDVTFVSAVRRKEPREVTIKLPRAEYHDDFNPDDIITTVLGGAEVQTASYDAVDCTLSLTMRV